MENGRCRYHGGKSLSGIASPTFKTGRYSKYLPERMLARYKQAASDPELLAMRSDIALLDARLSDVLGRVDTGEAGALWRAAREMYADARDAMADKDAARLSVALTALGGLLDKGVADWAAWDEVRSLLEQRRKLAESEVKREVLAQQMVKVDQAMVLVSALVDSVKRHVTDRDTLASISADFGRLLSISAGDVVDATTADDGGQRRDDNAAVDTPAS